MLESVHHSLIIGLDFLTDNQCFVQLGQGKLYLKDNLASVSMVQSTGFAKTGKPVHIPAKGEVEIPVSVSRAVKNDIVLLEPIQNDKNLMIARCLVKARNSRNENTKAQKAFIRILNPNLKQVYLPRNYKLASVNVIDKDSIIPFEEKNTLQNINKISQSENCKSADKPDDVKFHISNENLTKEQCFKLEQFLLKNKDVFSTSFATLGKTNIFKHKIETEPSAKPVHMNHYRTGPIQKAEIERQTKEMLEHGIITQSSSIWHSPVVLVKKKNNTWRFAIDYRKLNQITKSISHPLPRLEDVFDCIGESAASIFSTLDLNSAYFQMELDSETKHKAAFITHEGVFEWQRLPFGLKNAPMSFQMLMSQVLRGIH